MSNASAINQYFAVPINGDPPPVGTPRPLIWPLGVVENYMITEFGEVTSPKGLPLKPGPNKEVTQYVTLRLEKGGHQAYRLDWLMMMNFRGGPDEESHVPIHRDGNLRNCRLDNLEYGPVPKRIPHNKGKKKVAVLHTPGGGNRRRRRQQVDHDAIEVLRTYRHKGTGLSVSVDEGGRVKMPKVNLTAEELRVISLISARIAEMNAVLGVK